MAVPQHRLEYQRPAGVTDVAVLPQIRVETLIGSQVEFQITR